MAKYKVSTDSRDITTSQTIRPTDFGGWMAVNTGTAPAVVDGYTLQPGDAVSYTDLDPEVIWDSPIQIQVENAGAVVRITRLRYREITSGEEAQGK